MGYYLKNDQIISDNGIIVSHDPESQSYQDYLAWLNAGNVLASCPNTPQPTVMDKLDSIKDLLQKILDSKGM